MIFISSNKTSHASVIISLIFICHYVTLVTNALFQQTATTTLVAPQNVTDKLPFTDNPRKEAICGWRSHRLPTRLVPNHYELLLRPNIEAQTFEGVVEISLQVDNQQQQLPPDREDDDAFRDNQIILHADDALLIDKIWFREQILEYSHKQVNGSDKNELISSRSNYIQVLDICRDPERQLLVLSLERDFVGKGQLYVTYSGPMSRTTFRGFYRSRYRSMEDGSLRYVGVSQLQATEARRVFPCFDEPALKATFALTMVHDANLDALSNTLPVFERDIKPMPGETNNRSEKLVRFAETPPMSTYLLAFALGEFDHLERLIANEKLRLRIYTAPGKANQAEFAMDIAERAFSHMQEYFGVEYPLKKIDMLALTDFEAGAMENWGLLTFKENQLLIDKDYTSRTLLPTIAGTVVHELAHQWFGNLVTMEWWDELWLNEGFATWFEHRVMIELTSSDQDTNIPEFTFIYLLQSHIQALNEDAAKSAHPVRVWPGAELDQTDIDSLFDAISYNKAAALVRVMHNDIVGPRLFRQAMQHYLRTLQFSSASGNDLWNSLKFVLSSDKVRFRETTARLRVFLKTWIMQRGHPLITVDLFEENNTSGAAPVKLVLRQERFFGRGEEPDEEEMKSRWLIPVTALVGGSDVHQMALLHLVVEPGAAETLVELPPWFNATMGSGHWVKLNTNFSGFYRTQYLAPQLWMHLREPIMRKELNAIDRLNLIDEFYTLMLAKRITGAQLIQALTWFRFEDQGAVIDSMVGAFKHLLQLFENADQGRVRSQMEKFGRHLFGRIYRRVDYNFAAETPDDPSTWPAGYTRELGRASLLSCLVQLDFAPAVDEALRLLESGARIPPHLRLPAYEAAALRGSDQLYEKLFADMTSGRIESHDELNRLLFGLSKATSRQRLGRLWSWLREKKSRDLTNEDKSEAVGIMFAQASGRRFVLQTLQEEAERLVDMHGKRPIASLLEQLSVSMGSEPSSQEMIVLAAKLKLDEWNSTSAEYIRGQLDWQADIVRGSSENGAMSNVLQSYLLKVDQEAVERRKRRQQQQQQVESIQQTEPAKAA